MSKGFYTRAVSLQNTRSFLGGEKFFEFMLAIAKGMCQYLDGEYSTLSVRNIRVQLVF
jgi:hypothetical protein